MIPFRVFVVFSLVGFASGRAENAPALDPNAARIKAALEGPRLEMEDSITAEEQAWITQEAPALACPDREFEEVYRYRWAMYRRHLKSTPDGWIVTEFLDPQPRHAGKHGTISMSAPTHLYEGRWLRSSQYLDDYSRFWFNAEGAAPRLYSEWLADAIWARAGVTGDFELPKKLLPQLVKNYEAWERENQHVSGLYWSYDLADGMEISISGNGFRPTVNSYQFGNARAIARIAERAGDTATAKLYAEKAEALRRLVQTRLWDADAHFFKVLPAKLDAVLRGPTKNGALTEAGRKGEVNNWSFRAVPAENNVRELLGYIPWYFKLPEPGGGTEVAWSQLSDPAGFWARFGPTTAERRHPRFRYSTQTITPWNGTTWPFATSQTLTAMANLLRDYPAQRYVTSADYYRMLKEYADQHYLRSSGEPPRLWLHEVMDPDNGLWSVWEWRKRYEPDRIHLGKDYNHSAFNDLVISGLLGIEPQDNGLLRVRPLLPEGVWPWFSISRLRLWGRDVDVRYDRDGTHFKQGIGLAVWIDGKEVARRADLGSLEVALAGGTK